MTAAERKALIEKKLAEARAKIAAGLIGLAIIVDPSVVITPEETPEAPATPEAPIEEGGE